MDYIPQAAPFEMIDELVSATEELTTTRFTIREGHLFVAAGRFTEPGLIENMAQTAAAGTGFLAAKEGRPAPVGFIGALKNVEISGLPALGETVFTQTRLLHQVMNASVVEAVVKLNEAVIARAEFKIFLEG